MRDDYAVDGELGWIQAAVAAYPAVAQPLKKLGKKVSGIFKRKKKKRGAPPPPSPNAGQGGGGGGGGLFGVSLPVIALVGIGAFLLLRRRR